MAFTHSQANLLKDFINDGSKRVLTGLGKVHLADIPANDVEQLQHYGLLRKDINLIDGKEVWILTDKGKKVRKAIYRAQA